MSGWVADLPSSRLSYEALEVACHSIDSYRDKISGELVSPSCSLLDISQSI